MTAKLSRGLVPALVVAAGCSQIIGVSDYDIDPRLDGKGGSSANAGGAPGQAGESSSAGAAPAPQGGQPPIAQGGEPPTMAEGGLPPIGQGGQPAAAGQAADAGAGGAPHVPELVPCDSALCCQQLGGTAVGTELLSDGGFELGTPDDGSPWIEEFTKDGADYVDEAIISDTSLGFKPKTGVYYTYLSGIQGERATIYSEDLVVPPDAGWLVVSGYRYFQIDKQDATNADFALIAFYDLTGTALEIPFYWAGTDSTDGWGATGGAWKSFSASFDATAHQGKTRYLGLRGESDKYPTTGTPKASSYLFDDVSLKVFRCYK